MRPRISPALVCLVLACTPGGSDDNDSTAATAVGDTGTGTAPTTGGDTGEAVPCVDGGIGPAFSWQTAPDPGTATCTRISDGNLALDCTGDFTGIFTLELANTGKLGIGPGDPLSVTYVANDDGEWLQVRDQVHWYIVAGQGPTLAPPNAPSDWFHGNVEVTRVDGGCTAAACTDGSGDTTTPLAIAFGQGDFTSVLPPGMSSGVPGDFGGESYHAAVTEARTGLCGKGEAGAQVDLLAFSVVSSGFQ